MASVLEAVVSELVVSLLELVLEVLDALGSPKMEERPPDIPADLSAVSIAPISPPPSLP